MRKGPSSGASRDVRDVEKRIKEAQRCLTTPDKGEVVQKYQCRSHQLLARKWETLLLSPAFVPHPHRPHHWLIQIPPPRNIYASHIKILARDTFTFGHPTLSKPPQTLTGLVTDRIISPTFFETSTPFPQYRFSAFLRRLRLSDMYELRSHVIMLHTLCMSQERPQSR
jgi:hypothetical protein